MRAFLLLVLVLTACTSQPTASPSPIALPSFGQLSAPSGTVVWAMVEGARLFRSTDRGGTWQERTLPTPLINGDIAFVDEMTGLLLSAGSAATQCQTQLAVIWRTTDGAASWRKLSGTGIAEGMCKRYLSMSDAAHGLLTAFSPNAAPVVYRTADGGETWSGSTPLPDPPGFTTK